MFFLPSWCNKKSDPVRYVQCDSFKLFVSNAGCQMKEKWWLKINVPVKYHWKLKLEEEKNCEEKKVNCSFYYRCLANENLI